MHVSGSWEYNDDQDSHGPCFPEADIHPLRSAEYLIPLSLDFLFYPMRCYNPFLMKIRNNDCHSSRARCYEIGIVNCVLQMRKLKLQEV